MHIGVSACLALIVIASQLQTHTHKGKILFSKSAQSFPYQRDLNL